MPTVQPNWTGVGVVTMNGASRFDGLVLPVRTGQKNSRFRGICSTVSVLDFLSAGASAGVVHELMRQPLADQPGTDVVVITVDYPPGAATPPHEHPGYTYAYVIEGTVVSQLDDQAQQTFSAGQMWSEPPHEHHVVSRNGSATAPAKLLVFFIAPHSAKLTEFLPAK